MCFPGTGPRACWREPCQRALRCSFGSEQSLEKTGKCGALSSAVKETPDAEELSHVSVWKAPRAGTQCAARRPAGGRGGGLVWAGGGGLSRDLAFWLEDSGILGGSAKMSLRRKTGSLTCDLLT